MAKKCTDCWVNPREKYPSKDRGSGICKKCEGKTKSFKICDRCEKGRKGLAGKCVTCRGSGQI